MDEQPVWRRLFDAWEKEFGPRLEEYVQSDEFAERIAGIQQMTRRQAEIAEEATRQFLRFWNLPTASDLDKVNQQLAEIDRRLRALHRPVVQEAPAPGPRKRQGSKTAAGMKAAVESREAAAKRAEAAASEATAETNEVVVQAAELAGAAVGDTTAPVTSADTAGSAEGATAKASVSKARASKAKTTKAKASTGKVRKATPAKASRSSKSSAPAQKASQKAESRSPGSGYRDEGQNPKGEA